MKYSYNFMYDMVVCEPSCTEEILTEMQQIGRDYDGCSTVEELENLIDELMGYAEKGLQFIREGRITEKDVKEETERSYAAAYRFVENGN